MLPKETAPRKVLLEGGGLKQASQRIPRGAGRKLGQAKEGGGREGLSRRQLGFARRKSLPWPLTIWYQNPEVGQVREMGQKQDMTTTSQRHCLSPMCEKMSNLIRKINE